MLGNIMKELELNAWLNNWQYPLFSEQITALFVSGLWPASGTHARASTRYLRRALIVPVHQSFKIVFDSLARCGVHPAHIMTRLTHSTSLLYVFVALRLDPCFWNGRPPLFARLDGTHNSSSWARLATTSLLVFVFFNMVHALFKWLGSVPLLQNGIMTSNDCWTYGNIRRHEKIMMFWVERRRTHEKNREIKQQNRSKDFFLHCRYGSQALWERKKEKGAAVDLCQVFQRAAICTWRAFPKPSAAIWQETFIGLICKHSSVSERLKFLRASISVSVYVALCCNSACFSVMVICLVQHKYTHTHTEIHFSSSERSIFSLFPSFSLCSSLREGSDCMHTHSEEGSSINSWHETQSRPQRGVLIVAESC